MRELNKLAADAKGVTGDATFAKLEVIQDAVSMTA